MKRPGNTIFSRILLASVIPFALVLALVLLVVVNIILDIHRKRVVENVKFFAHHATEKIDDNLMYISSLLKFTSENMSDAVENSENGRESMREILHAFMNANSEIYCAWFVFKPQVASPSEGWYARSFLKRDGAIEEIPAVSQERLDDPEAAPWHVRPYNMGVAYIDTLDYWDYGIGGGREYTATIAYPIVRDGMIIGTVGMDILYEHAFKFMRKPGLFINAEPGVA